MKILRIALFFQIVVFFFGCTDNKNKTAKTQPTVIVKLLNISKVNEPVKAVAILKDSDFAEFNSEIFVMLEMDGQEPLKRDLSNEYDIDIEGFANLEIDTINQKWFKIKNRRHSAVFGKTFKNPGKNILRGYVWDFYGFKIDDSIIPSQSKKYFFEFEVDTE